MGAGHPLGERRAPTAGRCRAYESKVVVVPLLSEALDEPSAYEDPALQSRENLAGAIVRPDG